MSAYESMTVAQLRDEMAGRGVTAPKGSRKADLVAMLEGMDAGDTAEAVEPDSVEDAEDTTLAVTLTAGTIAANFDALGRRVDQLIEPYRGASYDLTDPDAVRQAKRDRAYLNSLAKELRERSRAVKRDYNRPLDEFMAQVNSLVSRISEVSDEIKAQVDRAEEERRAKRLFELREYYSGIAQALEPVVPYERFHEDCWLNKTFAITKAEDELDRKVEKVCQDWETLRASEGQPHYAEAEREFFRTLDLGAALTAMRLATEEDARIAALKAHVDAPVPVVMEGGPNGGTTAETYMPEPVPAPEPYQPEPAPTPEPQPEPAPYVPEPYAPESEPQACEPVPFGLAPQTEPAQSLVDRAIELSGGMVRPVLQAVLDRIPSGYGQTDGHAGPCVAVIDSATTRQMDLMGRCMGGVGCTARFYRGTLADAYAAWSQEVTPYGR